MSHFTVTVALPGTLAEHEIEAALAEALAPFDENKDVPRYVSATKAELIEKGRRKIEEYKAGAYAEFRADPVAYAAKCRNLRHLEYIAGGAEALLLEPELAARYTELVSEFEKMADEEYERFGRRMGDKRDVYKPMTFDGSFPAKLDWTDEQVYADEIEWESAENIGPDGEIYSEYNPEQFGLVLCGGGQGQEADQSARNEVLREVFGNEAAGIVWEGVAESRRPVHVLQGVHGEPESESHVGAASGLALDAEVRNHAGAVHGDAVGAEREVRDLRNDRSGSTYQEYGNEGVRGGSLPCDGQGSGTAVLRVQRYVGRGEGFLRHVDCGDPVSHAPHLISKAVIGGAKWDWYSIGGRWAAYFSVLEQGERTSIPSYDAVREFAAMSERIRPGSDSGDSKYLRERDDRPGMWADVARKCDIDFEKTGGEYSASTYAFVNSDGEWIEKGQMGWFGMSSGDKDQDAWDQEFTALVAKEADNAWFVLVDCHI